MQSRSYAAYLSGLVSGGRILYDVSALSAGMQALVGVRYYADLDATLIGFFVPEPGVAMALMAGALLGIGRRRRRSRDAGGVRARG